MNHQKLVWLIAGSLLSVAIVVVLAVSWQSSSGTPSCRTKGEAYVVNITHGKMVPSTTMAHLCDTLAVKNTDPITRDIAFGYHDNHVAYNGITERELTKGESFTVTLNKTGTYHFHDHLHSETEGFLIIAR